MIQDEIDSSLRMRNVSVGILYLHVAFLLNKEVKIKLIIYNSSVIEQCTE